MLHWAARLLNHCRRLTPGPCGTGHRPGGFDLVVRFFIPPLFFSLFPSDVANSCHPVMMLELSPLTSPVCLSPPHRLRVTLNWWHSPGCARNWNLIVSIGPWLLVTSLADLLKELQCSWIRSQTVVSFLINAVRLVKVVICGVQGLYVLEEET